MSFAPPLVRLCRVWVDADGSVAVFDGCVGFLHFDVHTDTQTETFSAGSERSTDELWINVGPTGSLTSLAWRTEWLPEGSA